MMYLASIGYRAGAVRLRLLALVLILMAGAADLRADDNASVTVIITQKAPIETLASDGSVTKMTESVMGTSLTLVSQDGARVILQDAQGTHYRIALTATNYQPPAATPVAAVPAPVAPVAPPPPPAPVVPSPTITATAPSNDPAPVPSGAPLVVNIGSRKTTNAMAVWPPGGFAGQPLVIAAHGNGGSGPGEIRGWLALAKSHHFTIVCPSFRSSVNAQFLADDESYLKDCISWIKDNLQYDQDRVFMTGFSGGGYATWYLATKRPEFFHGIFLQSGNFMGYSYGLDFSHWWNKPIKVIWGSEDLADIPIEGQQALDILKARDCKNFTSEIVPGAHHQEHQDMVVKWIESLPSATDATEQN